MITELIPIVLSLPSGPPRSEGIHQSRVIKAIAGECGILAKEWCEDLSLVDVGQTGWWESLDSYSQLRIAMGVAWEEFYAKILAEQMGLSFHPGEHCVDGIYMTPDGESLDVVAHFSGLAGHEFKLSYKSTKTVGNLETQWMWLAQVKGYAKAMKTHVFYVHVLFVCGDYSYPIRPVLKCWRVEFTDAEIDDNWDLIVSYVEHQRKMQAEIDMKDII